MPMAIEFKLQSIIEINNRLTRRTLQMTHGTSTKPIESSFKG